MKILSITFLIVLLQSAVGISVQQDDAQQLAIYQKELEYLVRFGYLDAHLAKIKEAVTDAIKTFQKFIALPVTGVLDEPTKNIMQLPRCGFPDIVGNKLKYALQPTGGWKKRALSYYIQNVSSQIDFEESARYMRLALYHWGSAGNLTFTRKYDSSADIISYFANGTHGDKYPFKGPGGVFAHAFPPGPGLGGDIHFDDEEIWQFQTAENQDGLDFYSVAFHELGHSMGLKHSNEKDAIMSPYHGLIGTDRSLHDDDAKGMHELYLKNPV